MNKSSYGGLPLCIRVEFACFAKKTRFLVAGVVNEEILTCDSRLRANVNFNIMLSSNVIPIWQVLSGRQYIKVGAIHQGR